MPIKFRTSVQLAPSELRVDFNEAILTKLRNDLEGICTRFGYIRPRSIEIIKRSAGQFVKQHFNGHIRFEMVCKAEVCNPPQGLVVKAVVRVKNEMGVLAESSIEMNGKKVPVLDIIVPLRAAGITSEINLEHVNVGDEIYVSVLSKRYQLRDKKISVIGKAVISPSETVLKQEKDALGLDEDLERASVGSFEDDDVLDDSEEGVDGASDDETIPVKRGGTAVKSVFVQDDDDETQADGEAEGDEIEGDADLYGGEDDDFDEDDVEEDFGGYGEDD